MAVALPPPPKPASRLLLPAAALVALIVFAGLYRAAPDMYFRLLGFWGLHPFRFPFLDTHAVLAAIECRRLGYEVYVANPCDVLTRPHVYSPLFLEAAALPIKTAWTANVGFILAILFIASLGTLPVPETRGGRILIALATFSTMTAYAIERGNNDLLIFIIAILVGYLVLRRAGAGLLAYPIILFAAFLKFYPAALMLMTLRERPAFFLLVNAVALALGALFIAHYQAGLAAALQLVPNGSYFTDFFGAVNLPRGLTELLSPLPTLYPATGAYLPYLPALLFVLLLAAAGRQAYEIAAPSALRAALKTLPPAEGIFLALGLILIVGCFFAGQNIDYRGIFFLLLLPGLWRLSRESELGATARLLTRTAWLIVFLMWGECARHAIELVLPRLGLGAIERTAEALFWLVRELLWWRVIGVLTGLLLAYFSTSEIGDKVLRRLGPPGWTVP